MHDRIEKLRPFREKIESKLNYYTKANQALWFVLLAFPFFYVYGMGYLPFAYEFTMWSFTFMAIAFLAVRSMFQVLKREMTQPTRSTYDLDVLENIPSYHYYVQQAQAMATLCAKSLKITKPVKLRVMNESVAGINAHAMEKEEYVEIALSEDAFRLDGADLHCILMHEFSHIYHGDTKRAVSMKKYQMFLYAFTVCHVGLIIPALITTATFIIPMAVIYIVAMRLDRKAHQQIEYLADLNTVTHGPSPIYYAKCMREVIHPDFFNHRVYRERLEKFDSLFVLSHPLTSLRILECERYQKALDVE